MAEGRVSPASRSAARLPVGTVTLLFADVEGSTRLLHSLGERYGAVRARLRELVRESAGRWNGHEVDWAGDGAFLAFSSARDAVAAAVDLQRAIGAEAWPPEGVLRLRIGIHTGEPEFGDEGYVGLDVHVAARICGAGHGDQVLVSLPTREVAGNRSVPGVSFKPLGRHRLKDVPDPQPLFQLVGDGLAADFPPLRTLAGATLPTLHHRLVGRAADLASVQNLLARSDVRLVTITGPGGAGKSRLALEVAGEAAVHRPVHLVGLAPISNAEHVPTAIARAVGVRESPGRRLLESVGETLSETGALLLLDNLEHLPGATGDVRELLDAASDVELLVTSRVPLSLSAEHVVPLAPLPVADASELFTELAAARGVILGDGARTSIEEICRRLDGIPLAIELVASRLVVLSPAQVLHALSDGLALEMEGPVDLPERQRTLRATLDWSYGLLSDRQRELHETLTVFAGGCSLTDARALVGSTPGIYGDLEALVAWSLLRSDVADGDVRVSMLETVREYAVARLASSGQLEELRQRHAERFLGLAVAAEHALEGPDQASWFERLELELDNIRAALDWFLASAQVEDALRAVAAMERFWRGHGHVSEARRWLALGLEHADGVPIDVRADALRTAARQATAQSDWDAAEPLIEEALVLFRRAGRRRETAVSLSSLGWVALQRGDAERGASLCEEALRIARELGDARAQSAALNTLGEVRSVQGDHDQAIAHKEEVLALRRKLDDPLLVSNALLNLGYAAFRSGDLVRSQDRLEESLIVARDVGDTLHQASALFLLAEIDLLAGDPRAAAPRIRESLALYTELDSDRDRAYCLVVLGGIAAANRAFDEAARFLGAADALRGAAPLDVLELRVLERYGPELEDALGARFGGLRTEGARGGVDALVSPAVTGVVPG
jgi:predicted ATPase/class 3 adenylate cyclase